MRYCGITEYLHNAAIAIIDEQGNIEFATESERFSKRKTDPQVHPSLKKLIRMDDLITWYEDPFLRSDFIGVSKYQRNQVKKDYSVPPRDLRWGHHHISHSASSYYTRPWQSSEDTVIMNIDGYGEYQSASIYNHKFELIHEVLMPYSIGSMYSMVTDRLGYKALEEEYIIMGMASYGEPKYVKRISEMQDVAYANIHSEIKNGQFQFRSEEDKLRIIGQYKYSKRNVMYKLLDNLVRTAAQEDVAASLQVWAEQEILELAMIARKHGSKLCYAGGVAQNVKANSLIRNLFDDVWIAVNPTDGGCALGAAAREYCLDTGQDKINFVDGYLGYDDGGTINPSAVVDHLIKDKMCGVVSGKAEFGPRALGNRSLLADPRLDIQDTVNTIKRREKFRPFAPVILEEYANDYFDGPTNHFMQFTAQAKHDYDSVTHVDGSARVQTVPANSTSIIRPILEDWYERTGVPMLLNTSLNVKGKPMCNDRYDAYQFEIETKTKVFYNDSY